MPRGTRMRDSRPACVCEYELAGDLGFLGERAVPIDLRYFGESAVPEDLRCFAERAGLRCF
jgi:hypothetical protein